MSKEIELKLRDIRNELRTAWNSLSNVAHELNQLELYLKKKKCQAKPEPKECENCY